jgi:putative transposase
MDEKHLHQVFHYVALNAARARMIERPQDWQWSSVNAHFVGVDDNVV